VSKPTIGVIPARWDSSRFPGKPLADLGGRPVLAWVWERAVAAELDEVLVATDDERIVQAVREFGGQAVVTPPEIETGTERVAAALDGRDAGIVVNIQGDEPFIRPEMINTALAVLKDDREASVSTLVRRTSDPGRISDPNRVKAILDQRGRALYFSRAAIPFPRFSEPHRQVWEHIGLYCYAPEFLDTFLKLTPTEAERAEGLEQLRVLESGYKIITAQVQGETVGIDTPEDLERARSMLDE